MPGRRTERRARVAETYLRDAIQTGECGKFVNTSPTCSPDLNASDLWLRGHVKNKLYNIDSCPRDTYAQLQDSILKIFVELQGEGAQQERLAFWNEAARAEKRKGAFIVDKAYLKPNSA